LRASSFKIEFDKELGQGNVLMQSYYRRQRHKDVKAGDTPGIGHGSLEVQQVVWSGVQQPLLAYKNIFRIFSFGMTPFVIIACNVNIYENFR
jgi:hypothetical protein